MSVCLLSIHLIVHFCLSVCLSNVCLSIYLSNTNVIYNDQSISTCLSVRSVNSVVENGDDELCVMRMTTEEKIWEAVDKRASFISVFVAHFYDQKGPIYFV